MLASSVWDLTKLNYNFVGDGLQLEKSICKC
jgi:hypothetical protein